jgi:hypothetical protein
MTTITLNPSASNHDASQDGSGVVTLTGELKATAGTHWIGLLLPGVTVPVGATINSATLYYKPYSTTRDDPGLTGMQRRPIMRRCSQPTGVEHLQPEPHNGGHRRHGDEHRDGELSHRRCYGAGR